MNAEKACRELRKAIKPFADIHLARDADARADDMIEGPDLAITPTQVRAARKVFDATDPALMGSRQKGFE